MEEARNIRAVTNELRGLFANKGDLRGFNDWSSLIWCVTLLEQTAGQLEADKVNSEAKDGEL